MSVIIPTYNLGHFVGEAIDSVLRQTYGDFEVFVIDDGSADGTEDEVMKLRDSRVRYMWKPNQDVAVARNTGLAFAKGEFVAFLDADDLWLPDKLARQVAYLQEHPKAGMVYGRVWQYRVSNPSARVLRPERCVSTFRELLNGPNCVVTSTVMVRRRCLQAVGMFDPQLPPAEDIDLWLRVARRFGLGFLDGVVADYRQHETNSNHNPMRLYRGYWRFYEKLLRLYARQMDPDRRRRVHMYAGRCHYLLGTTYLRRGRAREALATIGGALRRDWRLGRNLAGKKASGFHRTWFTVKPYAALAVSAFRSTMPGKHARNLLGNKCQAPV